MPQHLVLSEGSTWSSPLLAGDTRKESQCDCHYGKPQDYMRPLRMTVLNWAVLNLRAEVSGVA